MKSLIAIVLMGMSFTLFAQEKELKTYYDNGSIKSEYLYTDTDNYKVVNYFENGVVKEVGEFAQGKLHGAWVSFNMQGNKIGEASYNLGVKQGEWKMYDMAGNMRYVLNYENGNLLNATSFDANGKLVAETHSR